MKKSKRIMIASIAAFVVTAASTFAYFTTSTNLTPNGGQQPFSLNITNGQLSISAKPGNGATTPTWSYDVARNSTSEATLIAYGMNMNGDGNIVPPENYADQATYDAAYLANYVNPNRSPDIQGVDSSGDIAYGGINRRAIGAAVTGDISKARPGDALVVGTAGGADAGLKITNASNLTVKVKIEINQTVAAQDTIKYLDQAGWLMYVGGKKVNNGDGTLNLATVQTALDGLTTTIAEGASIGSNIDIRLELPLTTGNAYQNSSVGTGGALTAFNISSLFTIIATQENNPNWSVSGT